MCHSKSFMWVPSVPVPPPNPVALALPQLPETAADHRGAGGPAYAGRAGPGDPDPAPETGSRRARQLCGAAAEKGNDAKHVECLF